MKSISEIEKKQSLNSRKVLIVGKYLLLLIGVFTIFLEMHGQETLLPNVPELISPEDGAVLPNGSIGSASSSYSPNRGWVFEWAEFLIDGVEADGYEIMIEAPHLNIPFVRSETINLRYRWIDRGFIFNDQLDEWTWKVRARNIIYQWTDWSEPRPFSVTPLTHEEIVWPLGDKIAPVDLTDIRILIDASRDNIFWWDPQEEQLDSRLPHRGKYLADFLRSQGAIVDELHQGIVISIELLQQYQIVIRADGEIYTIGEIAAYRNYVSEGGRLLLLGNEGSDELAQGFDFDFAGRYSGSIERFSLHPITEGMSELTFVGGRIQRMPERASILAEFESAPGIFLDVLAELEYGKGIIIIYTDDFNHSKLKQPFIRNLFEYLSQWKVV